ncbi:MAG: DUF503 domain-containing protein [Atopostipes suicloacalis]|nr:DUF503 domain-containing protein [Atopostipes suicloacalis]
MHLLGIEVTLHLYSVQTLKEKRRIIRSILDRTHHKLKVSNAEVSYLDNLSRAGLAFAMVSNNPQVAEKILQKVINLIDQLSEVEIVEIEWVEL